MRFLHAADVHLDAPMTDSRYRAQVRKSALDAFAGLIEYARCRQIEYIVIAGDLFDRPSPDRMTASAVLEMMRSAEATFLLAAGNHDPLTEQGYCGLSLPENVVCFGKTPQAYSVRGGTFIGTGFFDDGVCFEPMPAATGNKIGVFHGEIGTDIDPKQIEQWEFDYLALGHIHKGGVRRIGHTECVMPGSLTAHGFDECGERFFFDVTVEDGAVTWERVPAEGCFFYESTVTLSDADEPADILDKLAAAVRMHRAQDIVRLRVTGQTAHALPGEWEEPGRSVRILDETALPTDIKALCAGQSLKSRFAALLCDEMEKDPLYRAEYEAALRLGLEAFEQ